MYTFLCESICSYCDFARSIMIKKQSDLYLQRLNEELFTNRATSFKKRFILRGTPSALNDEQLEN